MNNRRLILLAIGNHTGETELITKRLSKNTHHGFMAWVRTRRISTIPIGTVFQNLLNDVLSSTNSIHKLNKFRFISTEPIGIVFIISASFDARCPTHVHSITKTNRCRF